MRKIVAIVLFLFVSLGISASASNIQMNEIQDEYKIVLSGYEENCNEDVPTFINVFKKSNHLAGENFSLDKAYADLEAATDKKTVLVFSDYTKTASDGSFSFDIKIRRLANSPNNEPISGDYVANIKCGDTEYQYNFQFVDKDEKEQREQALTGIDNIRLLPQNDRYAALEPILTNNLASFVNYMDLLNRINKPAVYTMIHGFFEENNYDITDPDKTFEYLRKLIVIEALNEAVISNIKAYETELMISAGDMASWYSKPMVSDEMKKAVTQRLSGRGIGNINTYDARFKEALILEYVAKADGIVNVRDIINNNTSAIGVGSNTVSDDAIRSVMGLNFENYSQLASALLSYNAQTPAFGNNSGGGGGGGAEYKISPDADVPPVWQEPSGDGTLKTQFVDLENVSWAKEAIEKLYEENIVSGKSDTHFAPMDYITREEFIKLLVHAAKLENKAQSMPFDDVSDDAWYYDSVSIAYNNKIINGISGNCFGIGERITRQDMAVMVCRMLLQNNTQLYSKNTVGNIADCDRISDYAKSSVDMLYAAGIINGYEDGSFKPTGYTLRAEAAKVIYSLLPLLR